MGRRKRGRTPTKTIRIPIDFWIELKYRAERQKTAMWRILWQAYMHYRQAYLSHFKLNTSALSRISWYVFKLGSSVGALKENPTKENLELLKRTLDQLEKRLGVNVVTVRERAEAYVKRPDRKNKVALNDATKSLIAEIIVKLGEEKKEEGS